MRRARFRRSSVAQVVRDAVALYLAVPVSCEEELDLLAPAANQAMDRMLKRLDQTIASVDLALDSPSKFRQQSRNRNRCARI